MWVSGDDDRFDELETRWQLWSCVRNRSAIVVYFSQSESWRALSNWKFSRFIRESVAIVAFRRRCVSPPCLAILPQCRKAPRPTMLVRLRLVRAGQSARNICKQREHRNSAQLFMPNQLLICSARVNGFDPFFSFRYCPRVQSSGSKVWL